VTEPSRSDSPATITATLSADGAELLIRIAGRFDFSAHRAFRDAYDHLPQQPIRYRVDLAETTYVDSAALGMLLLLRDHAGGDRADVSLVDCSQVVRKILAISNFEQLFAIR
jgi:HptB-dependent secretion and biofilm anti anti-sigma factor